MNNVEIDENTPNSVLANMPKAMYEWMMKNYKHTDFENMSDEERNLKWETACHEDYDWKYGRIKICRDKKLYRGLTFREFYGKSTID